MQDMLDMIYEFSVHMFTQVKAILYTYIFDHFQRMS